MKRKFVTAKKLTNGPKVYRKWGDWDEGDVVVGEYVETFVDKFKKNSRVLRVFEADFKDGTGANYVGKDLALNQNGALEKHLGEEGEAKFGDVVQITFNGSEKMLGGDYAGKDAYKMDIQLMKEESTQEPDL